MFCTGISLMVEYILTYPWGIIQMPCNIFDWLAKLINSITTLTFPVTQKQRIYNLKISCFVCPLQQRTMNIIVFTAQCPLTQLYENTALASRHLIKLGNFG